MQMEEMLYRTAVTGWISCKEIKDDVYVYTSTPSDVNELQEI